MRTWRKVRNFAGQKFRLTPERFGHFWCLFSWTLYDRCKSPVEMQYFRLFGWVSFDAMSGSPLEKRKHVFNLLNLKLKAGLVS